MFPAGKIVLSLLMISFSLVVPEMNTMLINSAEWSSTSQTLFRLALVFSGLILMFDYFENKN